MKDIGSVEICAYGAINKNEDELLYSSSGGVVSELCREILMRGGTICASAYDYEMHKLRYTMIEDVSEIEKIRGSKYFQSDISDMYNTIERFLKYNIEKVILMIGTPCHCAAVKSYLNAKNVSTEKFLCVDLVCHGVGSNQIWDDFVKEIEKSVRIKKITFKDKRRGWLIPYAVAFGSDGREYDLSDYMTLYNKHLIMRDECHECSFASTKRVGDITVGDFWNVQKINPSFYNKNGVSSVLCNTEKGRELFFSIMGKFYTIPLSVKDCIQPNMQCPTSRNTLSDVFWSEYKNKGFTYVRKKYASRTRVDRIRRHFLVRIGLWKV